MCVYIYIYIYVSLSLYIFIHPWFLERSENHEQHRGSSLPWLRSGRAQTNLLKHLASRDGDRIMLIYIYIYMYVCIYIYIYIYDIVGPGNSLDVTVAFPSLTFPLRFRYVSVAFPLRFRSRFRCASVGQAPARRKLPKNSLHIGSEAKPVLAQWLRPRLVTCGLGFAPRGLRFQASPPTCCQ